MKKLLLAFFTLVCFSASIFAQIPVKTLVQIVKAEDELRYDKTLEDLMKSPDAKIRIRAALAAGRIGDETAIDTLANLLEKDSATEVRAMAAFAIGEIESIKGADAILKVLKNTENPDSVRARAAEAAGKIAAANAKDEKSKLLGEAILDILEYENRRGKQQNRETVTLGLTAALRAKPEETGFVVAKFLTNLDGRIRADAANTLSRIRAKNANEQLRAMLLSETDVVARANAARALGAAEDKDSFSVLLETAIEDDDSRVRVSAIRSLGSLKDAKAADKLLERGEKLLSNYKKSKFVNPNEKNELLEMATVLGRLLPKTNDEGSIKFLINFRKLDKLSSPETEIAFARITPQNFLDAISVETYDAQQTSSFMQGLGEFTDLNETEETKPLHQRASNLLLAFIQNSKSSNYAVSDALNSYAKFKTTDLDQVLRDELKHKDIFIRATAAGLLAERMSNKENVEALNLAFAKSLSTDKNYNDAQLSILSALVKLDKTQAAFSLTLALNAPDFLMRRHAAQLAKQNNLVTNVLGFNEKVGGVKPYNPKTHTKLGQVLNTNADYVRAVSRKNGAVKAVLTTEKGTFTIDLTPEDAPLTVDNFIKLARANYFNGLAIHRVVPNFVMQDGDPRGDGNGGPGWQIRCEINMLSYERGAVGMALSGKDTGGSQWFVTHSPQPHLDGGYTVFGKVNETDMKIVDNLVRGDKITSVKIVEGNLPQRTPRTPRKKK
jgi:cyclophilin family peptidyl-prolyl cis-trans isomerase/HEAT repeat protein